MEYQVLSYALQQVYHLAILSKYIRITVRQLKMSTVYVEMTIAELVQRPIETARRDKDDGDHAKAVRIHNINKRY